MTPLAATAGAPPASASSGGTRGAGHGEGARDAFAQALERRQTPRSTAPASDTGLAGPVDGAPSETTAAPGEAGNGIDAPSTQATVADVQTPAWPPVGLAALLGFPDDPATSDTPAAAPAVPRPAGVTGSAGGTPAAPPLAAGLPMPEVDPAVDLAAPPLAAAAGDAPTVDDGAPAPAPAAFALPAPAALREPAPMLAAPLPAPEVGADDFEARFGAQLQWMAEQKIGQARIRVTPHDLGPVEVRLQLDGDRIRAEFVAPQAETRQALEQGLPRLRDLLGEHGFQLAHAGVGHGDAGGQGAGAGNPSRDGDASTALDEPGTSRPVPPAAARRGLLDAYA